MNVWYVCSCGIGLGSRFYGVCSGGHHWAEVQWWAEVMIANLRLPGSSREASLGQERQAACSTSEHGMILMYSLLYHDGGLLGVTGASWFRYGGRPRAFAGEPYEGSASHTFLKS